jgi:hypothetical protein
MIFYGVSLFHLVSVPMDCELECVCSGVIPSGVCLVSVGLEAIKSFFFSTVPVLTGSSDKWSKGARLSTMRNVAQGDVAGDMAKASEGRKKLRSALTDSEKKEL